jgi:hypothetical protein
LLEVFLNYVHVMNRSIVIFARPPLDEDCKSKLCLMRAPQSEFVFAPKSQTSFVCATAV